ncbi:MAG: hypothetical protein H7Y15_16800, partial [Pseudonocardia sp.]|nr:hypothetical protein [Pseudonocardia sp.]
PSAGVDPETGLPVGGGGGDQGSVVAGQEVFGTPTELASGRQSGLSNQLLYTLVAIQLLLLLVVPALVGRSMARRRDS